MEQALTQTQRMWAERIARWEKSRLGREEFAAKEGITGERLTWWRWKLRRLGVISAEAVTASSVPGFVRLETPAPAPSTEQTEPLALVVGGGLVLRIPVGFDAQTLTRVMALLARGEA